MGDAELREKFLAWLNSLHLALQTENSANGSSEELPNSNESSIVATIRETLEEDDNQAPDWIVRKPTLTSSMVSMADSLRERLKRLCVPTLCNRFLSLKQELANCQDDFSDFYRASVEDSDVCLDSRAYLASNVGRKNAVTALCKFADYGHRLGVICDKDMFKLNSIISKESRRLSKFGEELVKCREKEILFDGKDEARLLDNATAALDQRFQLLDSELSSALEEEERARKAYELAMQRTASLKKRVTAIGSFVDLFSTQKEIMGKINKLRLSVAQFNKDSAERRLKMLSSLKDHIRRESSRFLSPQMQADCQALFEHLANQFLTLETRLKEWESSDSSSRSPSVHQSLALIFRIGLEALRVWRSLGADRVYTHLSPLVDGLQSFLREALARLPPQEASVHEATHTDSVNPPAGRQTVVLFFEHVFHDTPDDHVESQARVTTAMKLLRRRVNAQRDGGDGMRKVILRNCNDVAAPPSWCLPLVHSPQYLSHLAELATEAKQEDLFVPLEFETEWESDEESSLSEDNGADTVKRRRRRSNVKSKRLSHVFDMDGEAKQLVGEQVADTLRDLLNPHKVDILLSQCVRLDGSTDRDRDRDRDPRDRKPPVRGGAARGAASGLAVSSSSSSSFFPSSSSPSPPPPLPPSSSYSSSHVASAAAHSSWAGAQPEAGGDKGVLVRTPYGNGTLEEVRCADNMAKVRLDWGATAFLQSHTVVRTRRPRAPRPAAESTKREVVPQDFSQRFVHTDLRLHRRFRRILSQVKVQRLLLDKVGVKDAILSLWVHGRTSSGVTLNVEQGIRNWLRKYDLRKLDELLTHRETRRPLLDARPDSADSFFEEMEQLRLPHPPPAYSEPPPSPPPSSSSGDAPDGVHIKAEPVEETHASMREEALKYSKARITKKSGLIRQSFVRKPRGDVSARSSTPPVGVKAGAGRRWSWGRRTEPLYSVPEMHPKLARMNELLRLLMYLLSSTLNLNQTSFAMDMERRYGVRFSQTCVSAWVRYKANDETTRRYNHFILQWLVFHRKLLPPEQQRLVDELQALYTELSACGQAGLLPSSSRAVDVKEEEGEEEEGVVEEEVEEEGEREGEEGVEASPAVTAAGEQEDGKAEDGSDDSEEDEADEAEEEDGEENEKREESRLFSTEIDGEAVRVADVHLLTASTAMSSTPEAVSDGVAIKQEPLLAGEHPMDVQPEEEAGEGEAEDHGESPGGPALSPDCSTTELHAAVMQELDRRRVTHSYAAQEASRLSYRMTQPMLSKFGKEAYLANTPKARMARASLINWVNFSRRRPVTHRDENSFCSACGRSRFNFSSQILFLAHVGGCGKVPLHSEASRGLILVAPEDLDDDYRRGPRGPRGRARAGQSASREEVGEEVGEEESGEGGEGEDSGGEAESDWATEEGDACEFERRLAAGEMSLVTGSPTDGAAALCARCGLAVDAEPMLSRLSCTTCAAHYHRSCLGSVHRSTEAGKEAQWRCPSCILQTLDQSQELVDVTDRLHACVRKTTVFVLLPSSPHWQAAVVVKTHSQHAHMVLVKLPDQVQWIDLRGVRLRRPLSSMSLPRIPPLPRKRRRIEPVPRETRAPPPKRLRLEPAHRRASLVPPPPPPLLPSRRASRARPAAVAPAPAPRRGTAAVGQDSDEEDAPIKSSSAGEGMTDTYVGSQSLQAALCAAGTACRAVDIVLTQPGSNAFACTRPPGHHAGRFGCTRSCLSTGFCLLNNAAIALTYARVRYGLQRVAVVDIDVHFGNGTAEILRADPDAFFASVHMVYGRKNDGHVEEQAEAASKDDQLFGFYPAFLGQTECADNYVSVGVLPANLRDVLQRHSRRRRRNVAASAAAESESDAEEEEEEEDEEDEGDGEEGREGEAGEDEGSLMSVDTSPAPAPARKEVDADFVGPEGYLRALREVIVPRMEAFRPELLIISAGFDGFLSDPLGNELELSLQHYTASTTMLVAAMDRLAGKPGAGRVISLLEGGYDTSPNSLGLARCVDTHVAALQIVDANAHLA